MPRFFFDFAGDGVGGADDIGCEFASVEVAFVEAYQSMVRIAADLLLEHKDPSALAVTIRATDGEALMVLSYDEVCRRNWARPKPDDLREAVRLQVARSRTLSAEVESACHKVRVSLEAIRAAIGGTQLQT